MEQLELFPQNKVEIAIQQLKDYEHIALEMDRGGYHLAFSGGKDSIACMVLCDLANVKYAAHYNVTGIDPPELVYNIRENYPNVQSDMYEQSMYSLIIKKGMPPMIMMRYCCQELKERGGKGKFVITGVRRAESTKRSGRGNFEIVTSKKKDAVIMNNDNDETRNVLENCQIKGKRVLNPIVYWTDEEVWELIHSHPEYKYPVLYDEGWDRIGCIGCPLAPLAEREMEFERYPRFKQYYINAFQKMVDKLREKPDFKGNWVTGEEVFNWWLYDNKPKIKQVFGQIEMDFNSDIDLAY